MGACVYVFQPPLLSHFYLPAYDGRLGHIYFSIPYAMHACIHTFVLHAPGSAHHANCIVFQLQIEYMLVVAFHMPCLEQPSPFLVSFRMCCINQLKLGSCIRLLTSFCFGLEYSVSIYALAYRMRVSVGIAA